MGQKFSLFIFSLILLGSNLVLSCPYCAGSSENPQDKYLFYIITIFIILTYIPFYLIFRMGKKFAKKD